MIPVVTKVNPNSTDRMNGGFQVDVEGYYFTTTTGVTVGGTAAQFVVVDDQNLAVTIPAKSAGTYDVVVTNTTGTSVVSTNDKITYGEITDTNHTTVYVVKDDYGDTLGAYASLPAAQTAAQQAGPNYNVNNIVQARGTVVNGTVTQYDDPA